MKVFDLLTPMSHSLHKLTLPGINIDNIRRIAIGNFI